MSVSRQKIEAEIRKQEEGLDVAKRTLHWHLSQQQHLNGLLHEIAGRIQALKGLLEVGDGEGKGLPQGVSERPCVSGGEEGPGGQECGAPKAEAGQGG